MDAILRNVHHAIRVLSRSPGFTATVVLTLALGIGATSAVFSVIDTVLLRPLPFPEAYQLVRIIQKHPRTGETGISPARLNDWSQSNTTFQAVTGYFVEDVSDTTGDLPEKIRRATVAPDFLEVWRVAPAMGQGFLPEDYAVATRVLVSDRYWRDRLAADPKVLGRAVHFGDKSFEIAGVMPRSFLFPDRDVDMWLPSAVAPASIPRGATWYTGVGRLKPGVSPSQAEANLSVVQAQVAQKFPDTDREISVAIVPLKDATVADVRESLWLLLGAVCVLLLIACTNIAALLLSRSAQREQEIAIRFSLGASRTAVAVQILVETAVLAIMGGVLGVFVAAAGCAAFRRLAPDFPRMEELAVNWRLVGFAVTVALFVALVCGLLPALRSTRVGASLRTVGRTQTSSRSTAQWLLVGAQVALSVTLLAGAGLLLRSFDQLSRIDPGFDARNVLSFQVSGSYAETRNYDRVVQRIEGTIDELSRLPGVEVVATAAMLPGIGGQAQGEFALLDEQVNARSGIVAESRVVSTRYFEALRIPLLSGELCRRLSNADVRKGDREVMVNSSFASRFLSGRSALGLNLKGANSAMGGRIVGVVGDSREVGIDREPPPVVYSCFSSPNPMPMYLLRTSADPSALASAIRRKLKEIEPLRSVYSVAPLQQRIDATFAQNRLRTTLLIMFAAAALALACLGVYGTLNYTVTLRRREIGLLLALGALRSWVVTKFLRETLAVVVVACIAGVALLFAFSRALSGMLFGVTASDPATTLSAVVVVVVVASLAALLPAIRAAWTDPMQTLRDE